MGQGNASPPTRSASFSLNSGVPPAFKLQVEVPIANYLSTLHKSIRSCVQGSPCAGREARISDIFNDTLLPRSGTSSGAREANARRSSLGIVLAKRGNRQHSMPVPRSMPEVLSDRDRRLEGLRLRQVFEVRMQLRRRFVLISETLAVIVGARLSRGASPHLLHLLFCTWTE